MRYRIILDQVMMTWYATIISWEPDGLTLQKATKRLSFDVHPDYPDNMSIILARLARAIEESQF